ncbi:6-phosphogluconolactonase [Thiotrichales bacterium 19S11-10]|nr:6-phosphogluconolactonase [Thiotrichales bacterium 19S11-10]
MKDNEIKVFETTKHLIQQTVDDLEKLSNSDQSEIHWALSGGSTPQAIFKALAEPDNKSRIAWSKIHFWWADDRCVPSNSPESNYGVAKALLLDHLNISPDQIHYVKGELPPPQAAIDYIHQMGLSIKQFKNELPVFDLIWLGMGDDGHTASLFPGKFSYDDHSWVVVAHHPKTSQPRVTLTLPVINQAKNIMFIVTGNSKAEMLKAVTSGTDVSLLYPAANVQANDGSLVWYVDEEAAELLDK